MEALRHFRDDGPLLAVASRMLAAVPIAAAIAALLGVAALLAGLAIDGRDTGVATMSGAAGFVVLAGIGAGRNPSVRTSWMVAPLLRAGEYGLYAWLGWRAGGAAPAAVYGLLAALAFHHYDAVYRLRHQRAALPTSVGMLGLGWEGRALVMLAAALVDATAAVAAVLGIWCALLFVTDSVTSWIRLSRAGLQVAPVDADGDE